MKNAIISVVIFFSLLIAVIFINNSVLSLCDDIKNKTDEIELILLDKDKELAYDKSIELIDFLKENDLITSIYVNHQDFDALKNEAVKLSIYISHDDVSEANASLHVIKYGAETVKHLQKPGLDNIF